jgi:LPXTG-motif cell wall-anchored protein
LDSGSFGEGQDEFSGDFELPAGTTGTVTVIAVADWKGGEKSKNKGSAELPDKCEKSTTTTSSSTTTSTTLAPTTTTTQPTVGPSSTLAPTTTAAVGGVTTTTSGGQLPFTGASSGPMLLAGIALVGGGALFLLLTRERGAAR